MTPTPACNAELRCKVIPRENVKKEIVINIEKQLNMVIENYTNQALNTLIVEEELEFYCFLYHCYCRYHVHLLNTGISKNNFLIALQLENKKII